MDPDAPDPLTGAPGVGVADLVAWAPSCGTAAPCVSVGVSAVAGTSAVAAGTEAEGLEAAGKGEGEPTATLEPRTEAVRAGLAEPVAELEEENVTCEDVGDVDAPLPEDGGVTTAPMGTSAAEASMINETKTASHAAPLRDDIGRPVTFRNPRRMGRPHPAGRVQGAPGCQQRPCRLARRPGDYDPASDPGKPTRSWDLHRFSAAGAGRAGPRRTPASRPDHETRR